LLCHITPPHQQAAQSPTSVVLCCAVLCFAVLCCAVLCAAANLPTSSSPGTLKLLIEDIISKLRKEGRKELTFGFAPLFNLRDSHTQWRHIHWLTWVQQYIYWFANNVYAFKNLAFSKVRCVWVGCWGAM
jgi:hypothetical protein